MKKTVILCMLFLLAFSIHGQAPINDKIENASELIIPNSGYDTGYFISPASDITEATRNIAEKCAPEFEQFGNCDKTIWYKFYLGTNRNVSVTLEQKDSSISQLYAGFNLYTTTENKFPNYGNLSTEIIALNKFGQSGNLCLDRGWHWVQVSSREKAKGELWIRLEVNLPNSDSFDRIEGARVLNEGHNTINASSCNSISKEESHLQIPGYNYSIWIKYIVPKNIKSFEVKSSASGNLIGMFFNNKPSKSTIKSIKDEDILDLRRAGTNNQIYTYSFSSCKGNILADTLYILLFYKNYNYRNITPISLEIAQNEIDQNDTTVPENFSQNPLFTEISLGDNISQKISFSCEGTLNKRHCQNILGDTIYTNNNYDKFTHTFYQVIEIKDKGTINLASNSSQSILFKGDIRNSCDLDSLFSFRYGSQSSNACLPIGFYTIIHLRYAPSTIPKFQSDKLYSRVTLTKTKTPLVKFTNPNKPENIRPINPVKGETITSDTVTFPLVNKTVIVDGVLINGNLSFKEFEVLEDGSLTIYSKSCYMYLFKGQISKNTAIKVSSLDYLKPARYFGATSSFFNIEPKCFTLKKGIYSLICLPPSSNQHDYTCFNSAFAVTLLGHLPCGTPNTEPQFAIEINNNKNVLDVCKTDDYLNFELALSDCQDCYKQNNKPYPNKCFDTNYLYKYYTFRTEESLSVQGFNFIYKGNVKRDPTIISDPTKELSKCKNGIICNLPKGEYTVVIRHFKRMGWLKNNLMFSRLVKTKNDFIETAFELGKVKDTIVSERSWLTCHTNHMKNELNFKLFNSYDRNATDYFIPYPDTANFLRQYGDEFSFWYTFTSEENEMINFNLTNEEIEGKYYLYEYLGDFYDDFSDLKNTGFKTGSTYFKPISYTSIYKTSRFTANALCGKKRYFLQVVVEDFYHQKLVERFELQLVTKKQIVNNEGDICKEAKTIVVDKYAKHKITTSDNCHSYGTSPHETEIKDRGIYYRQITTWFKIDASNFTNFNMGIRVSGASSYKLYGGTCGALTGIIEIKDSNSYFNLSCMGEGEYYVQAFSRFQTSYINYITLHLDIDSNKIGCKPYDFGKPSAAFNYVGGCNRTESIQFTNLSTQGEDIKYEWYANKDLFNDSLNPNYHRKNVNLKDTNEFMLIVYNSITKLSDTAYETYILDTINYVFEIGGSDSVFCFDSSKLFIKTNYPNPFLSFWSRYNKFEQDIVKYTENYDSFWNLSPPLNREYYLYAESENCHFRDSFIFNIKEFKKYKDTTICEGTYIILKKENWVYRVNGITVYDNFTIEDPGIYAIEFFVNNCHYTDTIEITTYKSFNFEEIAHCHRTEEELELDAGLAKDYHWVTLNDSNRRVFASNYGLHKVIRTNLNNCTDSILFNIKNNCPFEIILPTAFTPNGDGLNDIFKPIITSAFTSYELTIFNRWGETFVNAERDGDWDATYKGSPVPMGVYLYKVTVTDDLGKNHEAFGQVTLIR